MKIREIHPADNAALAQVIRSVLIELGVPKEGTAYADKELDAMYEAYRSDRSMYFVVEDAQGEIVGGAGIAPLKEGDAQTCELQKMYFNLQIRGRGLGDLMIEKCIDFARAQGFEQCYIETMPNMLAAQKLYVKKGFKYIDHPLGNTGHCNCPIWLIKEL